MLRPTEMITPVGLESTWTLSLIFGLVKLLYFLLLGMLRMK